MWELNGGRRGRAFLFKSRGFIFLKYMLHKRITSTAEIFQKMDNKVVDWTGGELPAESYDSGFTRATGLYMGKWTSLELIL